MKSHKVLLIEWVTVTSGAESTSGHMKNVFSLKKILLLGY